MTIRQKWEGERRERKGKRERETEWAKEGEKEWKRERSWNFNTFSQHVNLQFRQTKI